MVPDWVIEYDYHQGLDAKEISFHLEKGINILRIKNFPCEDLNYEKFIQVIGTPVHELRNNNGTGVFDVKVNKKAEAFKSLANSNLSLPLHTDCSDFEKIPDGLGLLCVNNSEQGGESTFAFLKTILQEMNPLQLEGLLDKKWHFRHQQGSIITYEKGEYKIRFDRVLMQSFSNLKNHEIDHLDALGELFEKYKVNMKLEPGDLILFRNDLTLHGREKFPQGEKRLFKRIRFHLK